MDRRIGKRLNGEINWEAMVVSTQEIILAWTGVLAIVKQRNGKIYFRSLKGLG